MAEDQDDAEEEIHTRDIERSITLGLSAASLAGILAAYAGPNFDAYVSSAVVCFSIVLPLMLTVFFVVHPAAKPLQVADYAPAVTVPAVLASTLLTLIGFGLLIAHLSGALGTFFIMWCMVGPSLVIGGCVATRVGWRPARFLLNFIQRNQSAT